MSEGASKISELFSKFTGSDSEDSIIDCPFSYRPLPRQAPDRGNAGQAQRTAIQHDCEWSAVDFGF